MLSAQNSNRSQSVGTGISSAKQKKNTNQFIQTTAIGSLSANTHTHQSSNSFIFNSASPISKYRKDQININVSEFNPSNNEIPKVNDEQKYLLSPNKGYQTLSQQSTSSRIQRQESYQKSRGRSSDFDSSQVNINQLCSVLHNSTIKQQRINENSNDQKHSHTKASINLEYYFKNPKQRSEDAQINGNQAQPNEKSKMVKDQFSATTSNLKYQKFNLLNQNSKQKCCIVPSFTINKPKVNSVSIPHGLQPQQFLNLPLKSKNLEQKTPLKQPSQQTFIEKNSALSPFQQSVADHEKRQSELNDFKKYFFLSSLVKSSRNPNNKNRNNNSNNPSSILNSMNDIDENSKLPQSQDIPNDLFSKLKEKQSFLEIPQLEGQLSSLSKKSIPNFIQDSSDGKSPKVVNFSLNTIGGESRSLSRLQLRKGQTSQESSISSPSNNQAASSNNRRQLSLKERLVTIAEQDVNKTDLVKSLDQQLKLPYQNILDTNQKSPYSGEILPQSLHQNLTPVMKRKMYGTIRSESQSILNQHQIDLQNIANDFRQSFKEDFKQGSKDELKSNNNFGAKFKKIITKSQMDSLLPLTLQRVVDKPFKKNIEILKYGISKCDPAGPKIDMTEYEIFQLFIRIIDHYETAMKNGNDVFRKMHSAQNVLIERLNTKITSILDAIKTIDTIKKGSSQVGRVIHRLFKGITHLRFIFFEAEALTPEKIVMAQLQTKQDLIPPLLNNLSSKQLSERVLHTNFRKYFTPQDFDILIEYIVLPDLDALVSRLENYVNTFNSNRMDEMAATVEATVSDMFKKQTEYIYRKKNPQRIREVFSHQTPTFSSNGYNFANTFYKKINQFESKTNTKVQKSESQFQLNGQMDNLVGDLTKIIKKYQFASPFSQEINPELKQQLVKMYNTTSQDI